MRLHGAEVVMGEMRMVPLPQEGKGHQHREVVEARKEAGASWKQPGN